MNLLIDCHVFDGKFQGTRTYIQGIYSQLVKHDDINFYFAAKNIENLKLIFGEKKNVHFIKIQINNSVARLAYEFPLLIKKYKIDYAHFQYVSPIVKCCKEINTIHDLLFLDFPEYFPLTYRIKNKFLFSKSAKRADILLTVSNFSKKEIENHFGIDKNSIHITPNGILLPSDTTGLPDIKSKYKLDKYIMTVSRIEPRKNHQMLLRAYVELGLYKLGYKLLIIGVKDINNHAFNSFYDKLSKEIKDQILIFQAPFLDLISLYKHADLFIFPSYAEGFGIPPIEATSLGCTTLCSNKTAMADFDFYKDQLFDPYNIEELKKKILFYLFHENSDLKQEQKIINERYNWKNIADYLYDLIINDNNQK